MKNSKIYIAVLDEFPDYMVPTLVAHTILWANDQFMEDGNKLWEQWKSDSFKKCVVRVSQKEFDKILTLEHVFAGHEIHTLNGRLSCIVTPPFKSFDETPNVLKFAKLWSPKL